MAAALPTPDDCCSECGCNDQVIIIDGTGRRQVFYGHGAPSGIQSGMDGSIGNVYYDLDAASRLYNWSPETQLWE